MSSNEKKSPAVKLDSSRVDYFLQKDKPNKSQEVVFQCIIVSLIIHIVILFVTQMLTEDNRIPVIEPTYVPLEAELLMEDIPLPTPEELQAQGGPLRNVVANQHSSYSNEVRDYRGMSAEQMRQAGAEEAYKAAQEEAQRLAQSHSPQDLPTKKSTPATGNPKNGEHDWFNDPNKTSYKGAVTASYSMKDRDQLYDPKPSYRCKTSGTVVVLITIDQLGEVKNAQIDPSQSSSNECLLQESLTYAKKWKFSYKDGKSKQDGSITFSFSAQ
jgi:TonB family protein